MLCITGLKKAASLGYSDFQDINQAEIFKVAGCAMSNSVAHVDQMMPLMRDSVATALTHSTAVHLAIPVDIQQAHIRAPKRALCSSAAGQRVHNHLPCDDELTQLAAAFSARLLDPSHEFLVAVGRRGLSAVGDILSLARLLHAPIVTTLDAKGAISEADPLCAGCAGVFGNPGLEIPAALIERAATVVSFGVDNHATLLVGTDGLQLRQHIEFDVDSTLIETRFQARRSMPSPFRGQRDGCKRTGRKYIGYGDASPPHR
jgi:acetolactate synthase-1/2/3 large subunit